MSFLSRFLGASALACAAVSAHAVTVDFESETVGAHLNPYTVNGVTFEASLGHGLYVDVIPNSIGNQMGVFGSQLSSLLISFTDASSLSLDFSGGTSISAGDTAYLSVYDGTTLVGTSSLLLDSDGLFNQTISYTGGVFDNAVFYFGDTAGNASALLTEAIDNVSVTPVPEPETYAMMFAGLGVLGAVAKRRRKSA
ncbi:putative secreted protein with PEP-CTERM sorting signal [Sphaerotilus hippei]|uniref:Putative secreted protein with PEP-CTERM sorting signal n=1 Tax=Sphaerotilus hippei TaxID=744406 RepID=A0A318H9F1_9BURK|nr:PEP-CTERM sorting domain-containing protein [Sphaerotilus hippei]PXW99558.1 putative secreted protein with PEP-CTERM sorting signal [Sphaerotilus hippei]